jgi:hypothetical protein
MSPAAQKIISNQFDPYDFVFESKAQSNSSRLDF